MPPRVPRCRPQRASIPPPTRDNQRSTFPTLVSFRGQSVSKCSQRILLPPLVAMVDIIAFLRMVTCERPDLATLKQVSGTLESKFQTPVFVILTMTGPAVAVDSLRFHCFVGQLARSEWSTGRCPKGLALLAQGLLLSDP